jgi:hypothetical protein
MLRMVGVIDVATEIAGAMKPRAGADENAPSEPFWTVVARGRTAIRGNVIVAIGTVRCYTDIDAHLSLRFGDDCREAASSYSGQHQKFKSTHGFTSLRSIVVRIKRTYLVAGNAPADYYVQRAIKGE